MNKVQKRWNDFFADKEWNLHLGWHYKGTKRRYKGERVSFFKTVLFTILKIFLTFLVGTILYMITGQINFSVWLIMVVSAILIIRGIYIIIRSLIKGVLWF